jgi:hypothetical protein
MPIKSLTLDELGVRLAALGQPAYRAKQVVQWLYEKRVKSFTEMSDLPAALRARLGEAFSFDELEVVRVLGSGDTTRKFLFRLGDGALIESVLIPASPALYGELPIGGRSAFRHRWVAPTAANSARAVWMDGRVISSIRDCGAGAEGGGGRW